MISSWKHLREWVQFISNGLVTYKQLVRLCDTVFNLVGGFYTPLLTFRSISSFLKFKSQTHNEILVYTEHLSKNFLTLIHLNRSHDTLLFDLSQIKKKKQFNGVRKTIIGHFSLLQLIWLFLKQIMAAK